MFIRNRTALAPRLARGLVARDRAALSLNVEIVFDVARDGSLHEAPPHSREASDPPEIAGRVLWRGTSVTAFARVDAPARPPFARTVRLSVADRVVDLAVYGDRRWERRLGRWVQSEPERFERLPLDWIRAFGGTRELAPHLTRTGLPHPGGVVGYPLNPLGRGICIEGVPIEGTLLPNIEHPRALIASPSDLATPHGFAPCPPAVGVRMLSGNQPTTEAELTMWSVLRLAHHAPGWLVFDEPLSPGVGLSLAGHGDEALTLVLPACPARIATRLGNQRTPLEPSMRSVHLDAARRRLRISWGHLASYHPRRAPQWIELEAA